MAGLRDIEHEVQHGPIVPLGISGQYSSLLQYLARKGQTGRADSLVDDSLDTRAILVGALETSFSVGMLFRFCFLSLPLVDPC